MNRKRFSARSLENLLATFGHKCRMCRCEINGASGLEWDHRIPLAIGGDDELDNLEPLCIRCHRLKTKGDQGTIAKARRQRQRNLGIKQAKGRPIPGSKASGLRKRFDGTVERRS